MQGIPLYAGIHPQCIAGFVPAIGSGTPKKFPLGFQFLELAFPQGRVALLQFVPIRLKALKPKATDFEPQSLGAHIRKRRLELELTQKRTADWFGVTDFTVLNWENGYTEPPIQAIPAILRFLGYDPLPEPKTLSEWMFAKRRAAGWSVKEAALQLGVDEGTWAAWERGAMILFRKHRVLVARLLGLSAEEIQRQMATHWNHSHSKGSIRKT